MKNEGLFRNVIAGLISGAVGALLIIAIIFSLLPYNNANSFWQQFIDKSLNLNINPEDQKITKEALAYENLIVSSVDKAIPAVVSIIITKDVPVLEQYYANPFGDSFGGVFGGQNPFNIQIPQYRQNGTEKKEVGGGSGFIVSKDGYIITNKHVVNDEKAEYTVITNDGKKYPAKVLARDALNDIAVIKIEENDLKYLEFGNSDNLKPGQTAIAIGNPLMEFDNSVSVGVISGLSRSIVAGDRMAGESEQLEGVIQTDAAINPGNSGGPLLNIKGEVVGVNVAIANGNNLAFSIPANFVKKIFDSVKETGKIIRPYLGIRYIPVTEELKDKNKLSVDYGILVTRGEKVEDLAVIPASPADKVGLVENDIVLEIDGKKIDNELSFARIISEKNVGDQIKLKVLHKGKEKNVTVKLEGSPE
ncbi:MAG: trypsin-like peptidase domain-containing protein [Candidatus Gracilibacteria bacterium]